MKKPEFEIIHKAGQPYGIRDEGGYLLFFPPVRKYDGQEDRYVRELQQRFALAEQIKTALRDAGLWFIHYAVK